VRRACENHLSGKRGAFNRSMQHHLTVVLKGGVYGRTETNETFSHRGERHLGRWKADVSMAEGCALTVTFSDADAGERTMSR